MKLKNIRLLGLSAATSALLVGGLTAPSGASPQSAETVADLPVAGSGSKPSAEIVKRVHLADGSTETTYRVGPITALPHTDSGGGMHGTHTTVAVPTPPPCVDCFSTSLYPDLTYADGSVANYNTGIMLHHAVLFDRSQEDVTCQGEWLGYAGRRLFASGNERSGGALPGGYGVRIGTLPLPWTLVEVMNMKPEPQVVFFDLTMTHVPASKPGMQEVTPVWLDKDNCGDSQHSVPAGDSHTTWQWPSTISGTVQAAGGHVHDGGSLITLSNATTGETICPSYAGYGTDPSYMGHIESMTFCNAGDLGTVRRGQVLEIASDYQMEKPADDVMSIMMAFVSEE